MAGPRIGRLKEKVLSLGVTPDKSSGGSLLKSVFGSEVSDQGIGVSMAQLVL